ncbi:MAG TPA: hypothetical protein VF177_18230 [Anaerolineae bacterium]
MELQAVTGQLYIVDGKVQEVGGTSGPGLLAQPAPAKAARGRERDFLFVHLTLTGQPEETAALAQDLLDTISQRFYDATGSVTAALRRAIIEINELLLRLNLSGTDTPREGAISCAVLRQGELFLLQVGEAVALLGHNFGVERLPPAAPDRITPLGRSSGIDIHYHHHRLQAGDMLLLVDPRIAHLPAHAFTPSVVDTEVELGLAELTDLVGPDSARLLLIEFTEDVPVEVPDATRAIRQPQQTVTGIPQTTPRRERHSLPPATTATRRPQPQRPTLPKPVTMAQATEPVRPVVDVETTARRATSQAAMGLSRFTGWLAELLARLRPPQATSDEPITGWTVPLVLAIVIPILVAAIVTSVYLERGRVRRLAEIKIEMGQSLGLAEQAGDDETQARQYYRHVLALAEEAETQVRPGDQEIGRLRSQAWAQLDRLDGVTRLAARPYHVYPATVDLKAVVLRDGFDGGIYTLDEANGAIYQHETDESYLDPAGDPQRLLFSGQAIGSHVVGTIVDMMWRPQGRTVSRDGLAMLDSNGAVITFYPNLADTRAVPLGLSSEWVAPIAISSFDERLYVLDIGARQIWKYFPDGDGFVTDDDERTLSLAENPGLEQAVDIAIYSEDGSLAVIYGDGRIRYYDTRSSRIQWDETTLLQNGLITPLEQPTAVEIVGRGLNSSIFVADAGSGRIVQISRGGRVLAQYRATDDSGLELFTGITDFAVAETPLRIFVTVGNTLYVAMQE